MNQNIIKDIIYRQISSLGYRFTPRAYMADLHHWYLLRQLFAHLKIDVVIDVGANEGQFRNFLRRRCGYKGLIISFEPVAAVFEILKQKATRDSNWLVFNCALGNSEGTLQFNVTEDTHFSSFLEPVVGGVEGADNMRNSVVRKEFVKVKRLEAMIKELRPQYRFRNIFAKIDTQGHDFEVLEGAADELDNISAIQTEMSMQPIYNNMIPYSEALSRLKQLGFEAAGIFPVQADRLFRVIEFDCVAVNTAIARRTL